MLRHEVENPRATGLKQTIVTFILSLGIHCKIDNLVRI